MEKKDWILLLVPIVCNGLIVYFVQRFFDKKKEKDNLIRDIKMNYYTALRTKIDDALSLHSDLCHMSNSADCNNNELLIKIRGYTDSAHCVYDYYRANFKVFKSFEEEAEELSELMFGLSKRQNEINLQELSTYLNEIRDVLSKMKDKCINLNSI